MSRYARKVDSNHKAVSDAFEAAGASVLSLAPLGKNAPDLLVGLCGRAILVEVKPDTHLKAHMPTEGQVKFAKGWRGGFVHLIRTPGQAVELVNAVRQSHATQLEAARALTSARSQQERST